MRIVIFGAGASKHAGYPLAADLLSRLADYASSSRSLQLREAWKAWQTFCASLSQPLKLLINSPDIELALTLPDLLEAAIEPEDTRQRLNAFKKAESDEAVEEAIKPWEDHLSSYERGQLKQARIAKLRLLDCLHEYFADQHHDDACKPRSSRDKLRSVLLCPDPPKAVITFNWDTLAERTLAEEGYWIPTDGYGIDLPLELRNLANCPFSQKALAPLKSQCLVLKLHGSFGWRLVDDKPFLEDSLFDDFAFELNGTPCRFRTSTPSPVYPHTKPLMLAYPSYLKRLDLPLLRDSWLRASALLAISTQIDVWGYSLPSSDGAARTLFAPLAQRLEEGTVIVAVHDPSSKTLDAWRNLLGNKVTLQKEPL